MSLRLDAASGTKVRYTGEGGWDADKVHANKYLTVGEIYTVDIIDIGSWCSEVYLVEVPHLDFNTVMFEEVE